MTHTFRLGEGNIAENIRADVWQQLVSLRIHFVGGSGSATVSVSYAWPEDDFAGGLNTRYNADLVDPITGRGVGNDLILTVDPAFRDCFQIPPEVQIAIAWTNPSTTTWALWLTTEPIRPGRELIRYQKPY